MGDSIDMLGNEILQCINSHAAFSSQEHFLGILSIDKLPKDVEEDEDRIKFAIVNTDTADGEGKHWFVIIIFG